MPDNTGRDARMKKEEAGSSTGGGGGGGGGGGAADSKKKLVDMISNLVQGTNRGDLTKQMGFLVPPVGDEPAQFVKLEDFERSLENLVLVHEIAIDDNFAVGQPEEDGGPTAQLYWRVKEQMHNVYWDMLRAEVESDPPVFTMVFSLLGDIKEGFKSLLTGNNERMLANICQVLDPAMLRTIADEDGMGLLDYTTKFLLDIMGMACAPVRDAEIAALKSEPELIRRLRGLMETLDRMKCDMANYTLQTKREVFRRYAAEYERQRFAEVQLVGGQNFPATVEWLRRNSSPGVDRELGPPYFSLGEGGVRMPAPMFDAYAALIDPELQQPFPELLSLDRKRLERLQLEAHQMCVCATVMLLTCGSVPAFATANERRAELARALQILCKDVPPNAPETLESLAVQALSALDAFVGQRPELAATFTDQTKAALRAQIMQIVNMRVSGVYALIWRKLAAHAKNLMHASADEAPIPTPPSFADYRTELNRICALFKKIISYNYTVYGEYYAQCMMQL